MLKWLLLHWRYANAEMTRDRFDDTSNSMWHKFLASPQAQFAPMFPISFGTIVTIAQLSQRTWAICKEFIKQPGLYRYDASREILAAQTLQWMDGCFDMAQLPAL